MVTLNPLQKAGRWLLKASGLPVGGYGSGGRYGGRSIFYGLLPGTKVDYQRQAGSPWKNSIVAASINWIGRNLPQAPPCVYQIKADGTEAIIPKHPLTMLLMRPNKYYSGRVLRIATFLSLIVNGNAYWYIVRGMDGKPKELWYLPHFQVTPTWPDDATTDNWITGYNYYQMGNTIPLKFEDVIHFRDGLDPDNPRLGLSPLGSAYREIVTDNEASGYAAALLKNMGIPGAIITPKEAPAGGRAGAFSKGTVDELKEQYEDSVGGDNRGRPLVLSGPVEVQKIALTPEEMLLSTAQDKPEERVCALIGIPAGVLGLGVGLEKSTYNNRESDREIAWYEGVIPRLDIMDSEIDVQLLPFLGNADTERTGADLRNVRALTESQDELYKRLTAAVAGPWMKPNEARQQVGLVDLAEGDVLYPPKAGGAQPEPNSPEGEAAPATPAKADKTKKSVAAEDDAVVATTWAQRVLDEIGALEGRGE